MAKELNLEPSRAAWSEIAKLRGWYAEPFFVQVWVDPNTNKIYDSLSWVGIPADLVVYEEQGEW
jgi:hypothetical protein